MMRVVVLGAGYAGLEVTRRLSRARKLEPRLDITLINAEEHHVFTTELHKVAAGTAEPEDVTVPLADIVPKEDVRLVIGRVTEIRPEKHLVLLEDGRAIPYDRLVVALGSKTEYWGIPGLKENSLAITGLWGALAIRERLERAVTVAGREGRQAHVVIGGGGLTGVELAGELAYRLLRGHRITLVEMAPTLLAGQGESLSQNAERILGAMGVTIRTGVGLKAVDGSVLTLTNDEKMRCDVLLWAGGIRGNDIVARAFPADSRDRALVDSWLRSVAYPDVYILGDAAAATDPAGKPVAATAQAALAQAATVVGHLLGSLSGEEGTPAPYSGKSKGVLVSLGPKQGLGKVGSFGGAGRLWKLLKDANDIRYHLRVGAQRSRGNPAVQGAKYDGASEKTRGRDRAHIA